MEDERIQLINCEEEDVTGEALAGFACMTHCVAGFVDLERSMSTNANAAELTATPFIGNMRWIIHGWGLCSCQRLSHIACQRQRMMS